MPDRVAKQLDELAGKRFAPGAIQEYGYLHPSKYRLCGRSIDQPGVAS
jgi:hypothetical protein